MTDSMALWILLGGGALATVAVVVGLKRIGFW